MKWRTFSYSFLICIVMESQLFAQMVGHGLIDGVYAFNVELQEDEDGFYTGTIQYAQQEKPFQLYANKDGDTIRFQEIDELLNPVVHCILIKAEIGYTGQWFDEINRTELPMIFYENKKDDKLILQSKKFRKNWSSNLSSKLFETPLSPTVTLGKYMTKNNQIRPFASYERFSRKTHLCADGQIKLANEEIEELVDMESFVFFSDHTSMETMLPSFSSVFVDSLQSKLVQWNTDIQDNEHLGQSRFPDRYYAICDIDYWTSDYVCGSFEYVGPRGEGDGFVFIFDRKNQNFIPFADLIRSGSVDQLPASDIDDHLGLSFNYNGVHWKGKFNPVEERAIGHTDWSDLKIKMKRRLNEINK